MDKHFHLKVYKEELDDHVHTDINMNLLYSLINIFKEK